MKGIQIAYQNKNADSNKLADIVFSSLYDTLKILKSDTVQFTVPACPAYDQRSNNYVLDISEFKDKDIILFVYYTDPLGQIREAPGPFEAYYQCIASIDKTDNLLIIDAVQSDIFGDALPAWIVTAKYFAMENNLENSNLISTDGTIFREY